MIGLREFELRLLDERDRVCLVIPIIARDEGEALIAARARMSAHGAADFRLVPLPPAAAYTRAVPVPISESERDA